jgi:hypothetical protein
MLDLIAPEVSQCPSPMLLQKLQLSAIGLLDAAHVWVEDLVLDVCAGESCVALVAPKNARVMAIRSMKLGDVPLEPTSEIEASKLPKSVGQPMKYWSIDGQSISVWPVPSADVLDGLSVGVSLSLTTDAASMPRWLFDRYRDAVIYGAVAMLYAIPKKPWTADPSIALARASVSQDKARFDAQKSFVNSRQRVASYFM